MKLLYVTPKPFPPDSNGGAQLSNLTLLKELAERGWQVQVLAGYEKSPLTHSINCLKQLFRDKRREFFIHTEEQGITVDRIWSSSRNFQQGTQAKWAMQPFLRRIAEVKPDILLGDFSASSRVFNDSIKKGITCIKIVRNLPVIDAGSTIVSARLHVLGNSPYSARVASEILTRKVDFIHPYIDQQNYQVADRTRKYITFINPVPAKGVSVAVDIARNMPQYRFQFVMGNWSYSNAHTASKQLGEALALENVDVVPHTDDMRIVYGNSRLVIVPSQFIETFGRVIIEANASGIPAIGSNVGGIPETIGDGGLVVAERSDHKAYMRAIEHVLAREEHYTASAFANAEHTQYCLQTQVDKFERLAKVFFAEDTARREQCSLQP